MLIGHWGRTRRTRRRPEGVLHHPDGRIGLIVIDGHLRGKGFRIEEISIWATSGGGAERVIWEAPPFIGIIGKSGQFRHTWLPNAMAIYADVG
jgi:hypothetical protein